MTRSFYYVAGGILLGAAGGFLYWYVIGCTTGHCPITSLWYHATAYGALMGGLAGKIVMPEKKPVKESECDS